MIVESINFLWQNPDAYEEIMLVQQLGDAIDFDQEVNNRKYDSLGIAFIFMTVGIIFSVAAAVLFLRSM